MALVVGEGQAAAAAVSGRTRTMIWQCHSCQSLRCTTNQLCRGMTVC